MTPHELHEIFHEAMQECPQFDHFDDDQDILGFGEFGKIPRKGHAHVIRFWKEATSLFDMGYDAVLPKEVRELLERIDEIFVKAVKEAMK